MIRIKNTSTVTDGKNESKIEQWPYVPWFQGVGHVADGEDVEAVAGAVRPRDLE